MNVRLTSIVVLAVVFPLYSTDLRAALVLNEALANEPGPTTSLEWVEVLNWPDTGQATSLSGYKYVDGGQTVILDTDITIPSGGFAILARKATGASSFEERWGNASGVWGDSQSESYPLIAIAQMSLRNSNDTIRLVSPSGDTSIILWTTDSGDGISWERVRPGLNDDLSNFASCRDVTGSTPGEQNSVLPPSGELRLDSLVIVTTNPWWGNPLRLQMSVTNIGFGSVSGATLSIGRIVGATESPVGQVAIPLINEENSQVVEYSWPDPPAGITHLIARVDHDADTANNSDSATVAVRFTQPLLIISEYLANPEVGGPDEWVEIHNAANFPVSLEGFKIGDTLNWEVIPAQPDFINPGEFLLLVENESAFRAFYPDVIAPIIRIPGWRSLNNTGDGIRLLGPSSEVIDSLSFRSLYSGNHSIERVQLEPSFANLDDWAASVDPEGATPGQTNSVVRGNPGTLSLDSIWGVPTFPSWGEMIQLHAAVTNNSFGPASGWKVVAYRDLDFSAPGSSLSEIGRAIVPTVSEDESLALSITWIGAAPGFHRLQLSLYDEADSLVGSAVIVTTVRYSEALLIISEYMAAPTASGPGEWIEIFNPSGITLSFMGLRVGDHDGLGAVPPPFPELAPGEFLVLAQDEDRFRSYYSGLVVNLRTLSVWQSLNDSADQIRLIGLADEVIDSVSFGALAKQNRSIERRELVAQIADPRDWGESIDPWDATPGHASSIRRSTKDLSIDSVTLDQTVAIWPEPIAGTAFVSNRGFDAVHDVTVSVVQSDEGLVTQFDSPTPINSGDQSAIRFSFAPVRIGDSRFDFLLADDDYFANNFVSARIAVSNSFPSLVISEYLADPSQPGPEEWVELYNASHDRVSLQGYALGDSSELSHIPISYPDLVTPNTFVVLCADSVKFRLWYPDFSGKLIQIDNWRELNNGGDKIRLFGAALEIVDSLTYQSGRGDNRSSERLTLSPTFSTPSDWTGSVDPSGATPGRPNSVNASAAGSLQVEVTPNPAFRSAGQSARIDYRLEIGESLTLKIYDRAGRLVKSFADESPSATGFVEWNGTDDDGYELRPGPYVLFARSEPTGSVKKLVVVIAP